MSSLLIATPLFFFVFGVLTIAGGVLGFVKAKSKASLIAGGISGALLVLAGWLMQTQGRSGVLLGLVVSVLLSARFARAYEKSKKVMPAAMMVSFGSIGIVLTVIILFLA